MLNLKERETPDLIVIWLAFLVGFVIIGSMLGMVAWKLIDPSADISVVAVRVAGLTNTLIGVIVGYLAGRGVIPMPGGPAVPPLDDEGEYP